MKAGAVRVLILLSSTPIKPFVFLNITQFFIGGNMNIQIFGKQKCFDTKKAERFFKERNIKYQYVDLGRFGMSRGELKSVLTAVGGLDALLDKQSKAYAGSSIAYLAYEDDKLEKLFEQPSLMRTPVVRNGRQATVGYCPEVWKNWE